MKVSKALSDRGWKDVTSDNKVKDNGLQKALEKLAKVADDAHDEAAKALSEVTKLAQALKKDRAVAAMAEVVKYLGSMIDAADAAAKLVEKDQAAQEKKQKAQAAADAKKKKKDEEEDAAAEDEEDGEDDETSELLTTKFKPLLKLVQKGDKLYTLVAKSGKKVVIMLSRKPIPPARRRILSEALGGGSTKYYPGTCSLEAGVVTFHLSAEVAGLTKLVKLALLEQSGIRVNKVVCRGEDGEDNEDD
ncbi:MAG: hypothetical protein JNN18_21850 [Rubrivivax sp.]|nr:hypothetical protein [Rubrivivax sp.]